MNIKTAIIKKTSSEPMVAILDGKEFPVKDDVEVRTLIFDMWRPDGYDFLKQLSVGVLIDPARVEVKEFDCEPNCGYGCCNVCQEPTEYAVIKPLHFI